jgi:hypothetical protein
MIKNTIYTREIKSSIAMETAAFKKKKTDLIS